MKTQNMKTVKRNAKTIFYYDDVTCTRDVIASFTDAAVDGTRTVL